MEIPIPGETVFILKQATEVDSIEFSNLTVIFSMLPIIQANGELPSAA